MYTPDGSIIHLGGQSTSLVSVAMVAQLRLSILKFMRKHRSLPACWMARMLIAFFFVLRIPVWGAMWVFLPAKRSASRVKVRAYVTALGRILIS